MDFLFRKGQVCSGFVSALLCAANSRAGYFRPLFDKEGGFWHFGGFAPTPNGILFSLSIPDIYLIIEQVSPGSHVMASFSAS